VSIFAAEPPKALDNPAVKSVLANNFSFYDALKVAKPFFNSYIRLVKSVISY